jgi:prophage regulatory protein
MLREHPSFSNSSTSHSKTSRRFLRIQEVIAIVSLSRAGVYSKVKDGSFPKPYPLGLRAVGWLSSDIDAWIDSCISATESA